MNHLTERLEKAKEQWSVQGSSLVRYRWKKAVDQCVADFEIDALMEDIRMFSDAACTWIELDENGAVQFTNAIRQSERDMHTVLLFCIAHKAQRGHVLQDLLIWGGLDALLIQHLGSLTLEISPKWLQDRLIDTMLKTHEIEDCIFEYEGQSIDVEGYEVAIYPVTQGVYEMVCDENPSSFYGFSLPVENVSWYDAIRFCNTLSSRFGLEEVYKIHEHGVSWMKERNGYRLLSEVEWLLAARAGENSIFSGASSAEKIHFGQDTGTRLVAQGESNEWGLYDCSGNVFEWCWNRFQPHAELEMYGPKNGVTRVRKGGGWNSQEEACTIAYRSERRPEYFSNNTGFRIARSL